MLMQEMWVSERMSHVIYYVIVVASVFSLKGDLWLNSPGGGSLHVITQR